MRLIAILLLFLCGLPVTASAQTFGPVALPVPSPFPASSVVYQWDYTCPNQGSGCSSSLDFPVTAISLFLVQFPIGNSTILMSCYIANLTTQSAAAGWDTSCTDATTSGFGFSQRGMTLNYAGNPNAASTPR